MREFFRTGAFPDDVKPLRRKLYDEFESLWFRHVVMPRRLAAMRAKADRTWRAKR